MGTAVPLSEGIFGMASMTVVISADTNGELSMTSASVPNQTFAAGPVGLQTLMGILRGLVAETLQVK
jgi:hypothetical protein